MRTIGITDSVKYEDTNSFERFEYPSALPPERKAEPTDVAARVLPALGFDGGFFNVEFFVPSEGPARIIEVNSRLASQFWPLVQAVKGRLPTRRCSASPAARIQPGDSAPRGVALSYCLRVFEDAFVESVPLPEDGLELLVRPGLCLSEQGTNDTRSYRLCIFDAWERRARRRSRRPVPAPRRSRRAHARRRRDRSGSRCGDCHRVRAVTVTGSTLRAPAVYPRCRVALRDLVPVDDVEPGRHVVGPAVLVVQVVGVLPGRRCRGSASCRRDRLSWFGVDVTSRVPPLETSQPQPEPKRAMPACESFSLKASKRRRPVRSPPRGHRGLASATGAHDCQKSEWLAWPPALFRTGPRLSGSLSRSRRTSSTGLSAHLCRPAPCWRCRRTPGDACRGGSASSARRCAARERCVVRKRRDLEGHRVLLSRLMWIREEPRASLGRARPAERSRRGASGQFQYSNSPRALAAVQMSERSRRPFSLPSVHACHSPPTPRGVSTISQLDSRPMPRRMSPLLMAIMRPIARPPTRMMRSSKLGLRRVA